MSRAHRPSIADIASAAGVSTMAVSYALRGSSHVSAATRGRILKEAQRMGYRPDPLVAQLMNHVRTRRIRHTQANLGLLLFNDDEYMRRLTTGVLARAEELGYAVDRMDVKLFTGNPAGLTRMLRARGIEGLLLSPCRTPKPLGSLLDWSQFAAVAMTYSISEPALDRVVPHHFHNAGLALRRLRERGYRRPAFALNCDLDVRANHAYSAAAAWSAIESGQELVPCLLSSEVRMKGVREWFRRHRPDAIVLGGAAQIEHDLRRELGSAVLGRLGLAVLDCQPSLGLAGIDQQTPLVGSAAVNMLVAQIHRRASGIPSSPIIAMVEGTWIGDVRDRHVTVKAAKSAERAVSAAAA